MVSEFQRAHLAVLACTRFTLEVGIPPSHPRYWKNHLDHGWDVHELGLLDRLRGLHCAQMVATDTLVDLFRLCGIGVPRRSHKEFGRLWVRPPDQWWLEVSTAYETQEPDELQDL